MKRSPLKRSLVPMKRTPLKRTTSLKRTSSLKRSRGKRRAMQAPITSMARGEPCLIRIPQICCFDSTTTVPCHLRLSGISGAGYIADELFFAFGCVRCHEFVDSHHDFETRCAFYEAIFRTQARLKECGVLRMGAEATA